MHILNNSFFSRGSNKQIVLGLFFIEGFGFNLDIVTIPRTLPHVSLTNPIMDGGGGGGGGAAFFFTIHSKRIFFLPGLNASGSTEVRKFFEGIVTIVSKTENFVTLRKKLHRRQKTFMT